MMPLLVLAFPVINDKDFDWIQSYRKINDELYYDLIAPHFTIVFSTSALDAKNFIEEVEVLSRGTKPIEFEIIKAMVNKDAFTDYCHEFLVPEKGYSEIIQLHDKLYGKNLQPSLRKDIEYIPHITIGNSKSYSKCTQAVDKLNSQQI